MPRTERALDEFDSLERVDANSHTHSTPIQTRLPPLSTPLRCVSLFPPECSAIVITANLFPIVMPTTFRYVWLMSRSRGINRASKLATKIARNYKRKSTFAPNSRREKATTTFVSRSRIDNYEFCVMYDYFYAGHQEGRICTRVWCTWNNYQWIFVCGDNKVWFIQCIQAGIVTLAGRWVTDILRADCKFWPCRFERQCGRFTFIIICDWWHCARYSLTWTRALQWYKSGTHPSSLRRRVSKSWRMVAAGQEDDRSGSIMYCVLC